MDQMVKFYKNATINTQIIINNNSLKEITGHNT